MRPHHRGVLNALVHSHDRVLANECKQAKTLFLPWEWLWPAGSRHLSPADVTKRASESEAALLERASAPSRPERRARRECRAGVRTRGREGTPGFALPGAVPSAIAEMGFPRPFPSPTTGGVSELPCLDPGRQ